MRAVLDANIYVSFILTGGETLSSLFHAWERRLFVPLTSDEIIAEVKEVCERFLEQGTISKEALQEAFWRLTHDAKHIAVVSHVARSKDVKDNKYLACAKDGAADYLVTGDKKHLLTIKTFGATKIVSPKEFVEILGKLI